MLLYFFHLDGPGDETLRERFFESLKLLERSADPEADCEHLLGFHHTADCGLMLTARGGDIEAIEEVRGELLDPVERAGRTPWDELVELLRTEPPDHAVDRCHQMVEEQPYHRRAYLAGAALCLTLGDAITAEDFALVGSRYFPDDGLMRHYLARARFEQGRYDEAAQDAEQALALAPEVMAARANFAALLLLDGQVRKARSVLAARGPRGREVFAEVALDRYAQWLLWRQVMRTGAHASVVLGLVATLVGGPVGLVPMGMGLVMSGMGGRLFRRQLEILARRYSDEDLAMALRRIHRARPGVTESVD